MAPNTPNTGDGIIPDGIPLRVPQENRCARCGEPIETLASTVNAAGLRRVTYRRFCSRICRKGRHNSRRLMR